MAVDSEVSLHFYCYLWSSRPTCSPYLLGVSLVWNRDINPVSMTVNVQLQLCWLLFRKGPPHHQNLQQGLWLWGP